MALIAPEPRRVTIDPRQAAQRRLRELLVLSGTSLSLLFALAVAFGLISG